MSNSDGKLDIKTLMCLEEEGASDATMIYLRKQLDLGSISNSDGKIDLDTLMRLEKNGASNATLCYLRPLHLDLNSIRNLKRLEEEGTSDSTMKHLRTHIDLQGISVGYLEKQLMKEVTDANLDESSKIYELEDLADLEIGGVVRRKGVNVVCPIDGEIGAAYVHSITDPNAVGRAEVMLSYTWGYTIGDIIDTLKVYCKKIGKSPDEVYVWICFLCVNQHRVVAMRRKGENISFAKFRAVFNSRVTRIGHILAMMAPWEAPGYLTRVWCVFEIFTAQSNNCKITITMPSKERTRFIEGMMNDGGIQHNQLFITLAYTDVEKAKASVESDRIDILEIVQKEVGYDKFNDIVSGLLKQWAVDSVIAEVETGGIDLKDDNSKKRHAKLLSKAGVILLDIGGHWQRALSMAQEALVINDGLYKRKNIHCAQSLYLIGKGLLMTGNDDEAMKALKEAVDIFDSIHGREVEGVAKSLYWIGWILDHKGDYDGALKTFREALKIQEKVYSAKTLARGDEKVAVTEVLKLPERKLAIQEALREKTLGRESPDTAIAIMNIGIVYDLMGGSKKALVMFKEGVVIYEKVRITNVRLLASTNYSSEIKDDG